MKINFPYSLAVCVSMYVTYGISLKNLISQPSSEKRKSHGKKGDWKSGKENL